LARTAHSAAAGGLNFGRPVALPEQAAVPVLRPVREQRFGADPLRLARMRA
jgi:hypothetical protein